MRGSYSVVRYTGDSARRETRNVGIIAWSIDHIELRIDKAACDRVIAENPHLDHEALDHLDEYIRDPVLINRLGNAGPYTDERVQAALQSFETWFLTFREPLYALLGDDGFPSVNAAIDYLIDRLVTPLVRKAA